MKKLMRLFFKGIFYLVITVVIISVGYTYRENLSVVIQNIRDLVGPTQPCSKPLQYSLGDFDNRFNISKTQFLAIANQAANIWEKAAGGKNLFQYSDTGNLKINLIYDYRQKATDQMGKLGIVIDNSKASYDALKARYDSLLASYNSQKAKISSDESAFESRQSAYEKEVDYWNKRKGAPPAEYEKLQQERVELNNEIQDLNQRKSELNQLVDTLNSTGHSLNSLAKELNLSVSNFNTVGASTGRRFDEGQYVRDESGVRIDVYQFPDQDKLLRLMVHEFGHSLGMDHVDDSRAIMYYLNEGVNEKPTTADVAELQKVCKLD